MGICAQFLKERYKWIQTASLSIHKREIREKKESQTPLQSKGRGGGVILPLPRYLKQAPSPQSHCPHHHNPHL